MLRLLEAVIVARMSEYIHQSHNVSVLMYHLVCPAKYRRVVFDASVDTVLKEVCLDIAKRYAIIPTATLLEHTLLTQGFMGTSKAAFPRRLRPQSRDSTWANLVSTRK